MEGAVLSRFEKLYELIEEKNGLVFTKDVVRAGIPKSYLTELVKNGQLERLGHGIYINENAFEDKMFNLQQSKGAIVFSHDTALFLHDLTDRDPLNYSVTVPTGYNTKNIKNEGVNVFTIKRELYPLGLTTLKTPFGNEVKTYNMERTICDMIRSRNKMDIAILTDALKRYVKRKDKNIPRLMEYAESFRIAKILRNYMEVLL